MVPVEPVPNSQPPELESEEALLKHLAVLPLDPGLVRTHVKRRREAYFLIGLVFLLSPAMVLLVNLLPSWGFPAWTAQAGVWGAVAATILLFFAVIARLVLRPSIHRALGFESLEPVEFTDVAARAVRRGRTLDWCLRDKTYCWRFKGLFPVFEAEFTKGRFSASASTPTAVRNLLASLTPERRWRKLKISSGPGGIEAGRPAPMARLWLYDLWLLEKILERIAPVI